MLAPARWHPSIETAPQRSETGKPDDLGQMVHRQHRVSDNNHAPQVVADSLSELSLALERVLDNWDHLVDFPEHQVTVRVMITDCIPAVVQAYRSIPDQQNNRAESDSVYDAITENSLNRLEDHNWILHMQFSRLSLEPTPRAGRGDESGQGGADKQVGE